MKTRHESNREGKPPRLGSVRTVWLRAAVVKRFIYTQSRWSHSFAHSFLHLADQCCGEAPVDRCRAGTLRPGVEWHTVPALESQTHAVTLVTQGGDEAALWGGTEQR